MASAHFTTRRLFLTILTLVVATLVSIVSLSLGFDSIQRFMRIPSPITQICDCIQPVAEKRLSLLSLTPTARFRDNLRNDSNYVTAWPSAGFSNQFIGFVNMIYLGIITNRVPILPPFAPGHMSQQARVMPFGDVYDLDYLRMKLDIPILEWRNVKNVSIKEPMSWASTIDELGCWTTTKESSGNAVQATEIVRHLGVDASYTKVPACTRLPSSSKDETHVVFAQLGALIYPETTFKPSTGLKTQPSEKTGHQRLPDIQLSCFDSLYFATTGVAGYEWEKPWSPPWRKIGQHLQYAEAMKQLGIEYINRIFDSTEYPHFIAVHVRRTDFSGQCPLIDGKHADCFPPLSAYAKHVEDIKSAWIAKSNLTIAHVVVMSDEISSTFWDDVKNHGWFAVDHAREKTVERFGEWHAVIIDSVIQSLAVGLVGTKSSTFTLVSGKRVQDWNGGFVRDVSIRTGQ